MRQIKRRAKRTLLFTIGCVGLSASLISEATWGMMNEEEADLTVRQREGTSGRTLRNQGGELSVSEERLESEAVALAQFFFTENMTGHDRGCIIEALGGIPDGDTRESLVALAPSLFTENMTGADRSWILRFLGRIPDGDTRQSVVALAPSLFTENMTGDGRGWIIHALGGIPDGDRESLVALAPSLFTKNMTGYERSCIINALWGIPHNEHRQSVVEATRGFVVATSDGYDVLHTLEAFRDLDPSISIPQRAEAVAQALERDMVTHNLLEGERFARIIQLIENPEAPFRREGLGITGQEALSAGREAIYEGWNQLKMRPDVLALLPTERKAAAEFPTVMNTIQGHLARALKGDFSPSERFRLETALEAIEYVSRIRSYFKPRQDMPTLAQSVVTLYSALSQYHNLEEYIKTSIYRDFKRLQSLFSDLASPFTEVGHFLESTQGSELVRGLVSTFETGEGCFPMELKSAQLKWISQLGKAMDLERLNPLVEALFMAKRGHCKSLMDPLEPHNQACADGVVLNFLRSFSEIPQFQQGGGQMSIVTLVRCDAVGDGITEPIPHGRR